MFGNLEIFAMARDLAQHAGARQSVVARNIVHADTPGYKQRDIAGFAESYHGTSSGFELRQTSDRHLASFKEAETSDVRIVRSATATPNGNTVSLESEILKAAELRLQHDMALSIYRSGLSVVRASLGRR